MDRLAKIEDLSFSRGSTESVGTRLYIDDGDLFTSSDSCSQKRSPNVVRKASDV